MKHDAQILAAVGQWKERSNQRRLDDAIMSNILNDPLLQSIVANYALMDLRGRTTLARLAQACPKSDKEI